MNLFYRKLGEGQPLIILHGLFGRSDNWLTIAKRIAQKHTVFLLDQRNHGESEHTSEFNYDVLANDLEQFIYQQNIDALKLIGHSMGGKVAMCFALKYPAKVEKLVIVDIAPKQYNHPFFKKVLSFMLQIDLTQFKNRGEIDEAFKQVIQNLPVRQFILKNITRDAENNFIWQINVQSLYDNLEEIFKPICDGNKFNETALFVRGGKSDYVLNEDEPLIKEFFPKAKLVTIPKASHWLHVDAEEEFCTHLKAYL